MKNLSQDSWSLGQDLNRGPPKYEPKVITTTFRAKCVLLYVKHIVSCMYNVRSRDCSTQEEYQHCGAFCGGTQYRSMPEHVGTVRSATNSGRRSAHHCCFPTGWRPSSLGMKGARLPEYKIWWLSGVAKEGQYHGP
jgi:hypothetical protein